MPLYEYQCLRCGKPLEILQKISEGILRKCPKCGGRLKKLVSESAFHLKGGGWYKTDYAAKTAKKEEKSEGKEDKTTEKKPDTPKKPETSGETEKKTPVAKSDEKKSKSNA